MDDEQSHIDTLLERYLALLNEYTTLRERLSHLQSGVFHGIARANFTAERGLRYGRDQYDDRMQASRVLSIEREGEGNEESPFAFTMTRRQAEEEEDTTSKDTKTDEGKETAENDKDGEDSEDDATNEKSADSQEQDKQADEKQRKDRSNKDDPLRWFGIFTPMPLRTAQTQSIEAIEQVIPQLVTTSQKMLNLEIEVRRARKKRAKAQAAADKKAKEVGDAGVDNVAATAVEAS